MQYSWLSVGALCAGALIAACSIEEGSDFGDFDEEFRGAFTGNVLVNQLGYAPGATKIGIIIDSASSPLAVQVVNSSGTVVWSGTTVRKAADVNSGDVVHQADFSSLTTVGTGYRLRTTAANQSAPFEIGVNVLGQSQLTKAAIKFFTWKRSGMAVAADSSLGIVGHGVSHASDGARTAYNNWRSGTFDVAGGWYDAGDFGKYLESHTAATFFMGNMFERTTGLEDSTGTAIEDMSLGITDGPLPDVLDELAWGTRWVRGAMPNPTTHVTSPVRADLAANKCTGAAWSAWVNYDQDTATDRSCMGPSTSATHSAARSMAMVSRLLRPYGTAKTIVDLDGVTDLAASAYADKLWAAAKEAFGRATGKHPDYAPYTGAGASNLMLTDLNLGSESPGFNQGSGAYGDEDMKDDEYSAAVELYLTACERNDATAVALYKPLVTGHTYYKVAGACDWGSERALGDPDGEEAGCGTLSIISVHDDVCTGTEALPAADLAQMEANLVTYANSLITKMNGQNYPFYSADGADVIWGSNAGQAGSIVMLSAAYEVSGDAKFLRAASRMMDYILGVNPNKISYVIGFGASAEQYTHDRAMSATGGWVRGTLVGGPHNLDSKFQALATRFGGSNNIDDPSTPDSGPALKRYNSTDNGANTWECKENAVNWNAAFANAVWSLQIHAAEMGGEAPVGTCSDGVQNQNETGVDCGGVCTACAVAPTCSDGIRNQNETGVDCGGVCTACVVAPTCNDGIQNQSETGVDCGGVCPACTGGGTAADPFQMSGGQVSMEAENYHSVSANGSTDNWTVASLASVSGGKFMAVTADSGNTWMSNPGTTAPKMSFNVNFTQTGTFQVHVHGDNAGTNSNGDSCYVGVDGAIDLTYLDVADAANIWGWGTRPITISTSGVHAITFYGREDGFKADKIVINTSTTPPTGNGPAESAHMGGGSCTPGTCSSLQSECGSLADGCGGTLNCGSCGTGEACVDNLCDCVPTTCSALGATCGSVSDACGGSLSCGTCSGGMTCGTNNTCQCSAIAAPTGISASPGNAQATLTWATVPGATSYTIRRSTTSGGSYTNVATGITGTSYINTGLTNGTTYYYVIAAVGCVTSSNSSQVSVIPQSSGSPSFQMSNNQVVIEAEHFHVKAQNGSTDNWNLLSNGSASGGQCMELGPENGSSWTANIGTTSPRVDFRVNFTSTGTFYMHIKADNGGNSGTGDTCFGGIDNTPNTANLFDFNDASNNWGWVSKQIITVNSTGVKTVSVWGREDGLRLDKIVINKTATTPTGTGPAESAQQ